MCYLSSEADRNWPHHPGYFFSEPSLSFGPWKVWPRGERAGGGKEWDILSWFLSWSNSKHLSGLYSLTITALHRWPVLCGSSSFSGFYKIIHLFASSVLGMVLSSCMLLLFSRKFYWFLNPNTNVNSNFIKISSVESCEWNLFSIENI